MKKNLAVILSGQGAPGFSGIALMELFEKHQIKPDLLIGSSGSAFIAILWALGYSASEATQICKEYYLINRKRKIDFITAFTFFHTPFTNYNKNRALLKTKHIRRYFNNLFGTQRIESLNIKTLLQTTDIDEGESFIVRDGLIADVAYASSAMLPFYPPIQIKDKWLGDGIMSEGLPLKSILDEKADLIISVEGNSVSMAQPRQFISHYSSFVQHAISFASKPRTALIYDLHHDELIIIPIDIVKFPGSKSGSVIDDIVSEARKKVFDREQMILSHYETL